MTSVLNLTDVAAGFRDPARDSQSVFRKLMDCMARPGTIADLAFAVDGPVGLDAAAAAVALTLFDFETPVWLGPGLAGGAVETWLRFHAGCPMARSPADAAFAVIPAHELPPLTAFNQGDAKYPDQSTTLIIQAAALNGGPVVTLEGPGVKGERSVAPVGLPTGFWDQVAENNAQFQFGVDLVFVAGSMLTALPRSTRVRPTGE